MFDFITGNYVQLFYNRRIKRLVNTQMEVIWQLYKGLYLLKHTMN